MQSFIVKYYVYCFLHSLNFTWPVIVLYFYSQGLDAYHVGILLSLWMFIPAVFEIPSSILADKFSRKNLLLISIIFSIISLIIMIIGGNFYILCAALFFQCIGWSLSSGTDEAFLYDNLGETSDQYDKIFSKSMALFFVGRAIASVLGGFLYSINIKLPFILYLIVLFVVVGFVLSLKETGYKKSDHHLFQHIKISFFSIIKSSQLSNIVLYGISFVALELLFFNFQPILEAKGLSSTWIGIVYAFTNIVSFIAAYFYSKIPFIAKNVPIMRLLMALIGTYIFINYGIVSILIVSLFSFVLFGLSQTYISDTINKSVTSDIRASAISLNNQFDFILLSIGLYVLGLVSLNGNVLNGLYINYYMIGVGILFYIFVYLGKKSKK